MRAFWITLLLLSALSAAVILSSGNGEPVTDHAPVVQPPAPSAPSAPPAPTPAAPASDRAPHPVATVPPSGGGDTLPIGLDQKIPGALVRPGRLVMKDGDIVADGKFTSHGDGNPESPYDISWELLMSASDTFVPRLGETQIPQRIALLHGAHVRVSGYIAFPLVTSEASECLVMLNQWDGCCIGVPPSPYDAVEVKLSAPADNSRRHLVRVGSIEGVFHIDPYVVERWLVGLYTMDSATLSTEM